MNGNGKNGNGWHVDRRIPFGTMVTLFLAIVSGVYGYAVLENTVSEHGVKISELWDHLDEGEDTVHLLTTDMATLKATMISMKENTDKMNTALDTIHKDLLAILRQSENRQ